jgi:hypothetical protein
MKYFIYMFENIIMEPIKNCFKKGGYERIIEGVNLIKVYAYMEI